MTDLLDPFVFESDYLIFDDSMYPKETLARIYDPPYFLEIKVSNADDDCFITTKTDEVSTIDELPQSVSELINKYVFMQHYIRCYSNDFCLHFNIKFVSAERIEEKVFTTHRIYYPHTSFFETFFIIKVSKLKEWITTPE